MSENLYEVLGVSSDASSDDIKKAFYKQLQQIGGPEKNPDEYKRIREAYDSLFNPVARTEYDTMLTYGEEINSLVDSAQELLNEDKPPYNEIIRNLKKAIILGPKIGRLRNLLGKAFIESNKSSFAIDQIKKALEIDPDNSVYWSNLGIAYKDEKEYSSAEEAYKKAIDIAPDDNVSYISLAYLYFDTKRSKLAYEVLDNAIMADGVVDFADFMLFYHKIQMLLLDKKAKQTQKVFEEIYKIVKTTEEKSYAGWMFFKFAHDLYQYKLFKLMIYLTEGATKLVPSEPTYLEFHGFVQKNVKLWKDFDVLEKRKIHIVLLEFIRTYTANFGGYYKDNEYDSRLDDLTAALEKVYSTYPERDTFLTSLRMVKVEFPECFKLNERFFNNLLNRRNSSYITFSGSCPNCFKVFVVNYGQYSVYTCPHCNSSVEYSYNRYSRYSYNRSSSSSGDCFVATVVYGSKHHPNLTLLRAWRDEYLRNLLLGRLFIKVYYWGGPYIADWCKKNNFIKSIFSFFVHNLVNTITTRVSQNKVD